MITHMALYRYACDKCAAEIDKIVEFSKHNENLPSGWGFKSFATVAHDYIGNTPYRLKTEKLCCSACMVQTFDSEWDYVEEHGWPEYDEAKQKWEDGRMNRPMLVMSHSKHASIPTLSRSFSLNTDDPPAKIDIMETANHSISREVDHEAAKYAHYQPLPSDW